MNSLTRVLRYLSALCLLLVYGCASGGAPVVQYVQLGLEPGPVQAIAKSDITISLRVIRISDIYQYPRLFSFNLEDFPQYEKQVRGMYPKGPGGRRWEYPFSTSDGSEQVLLALVTIKNSTGHILRMKDARVYLIVEGQEPVAAVPSFEELLNQAGYFQEATNRELARRRGLISIRRQLPEGFYRDLVRSHRTDYKLINDVGKEILPGFTYDGLLAFSVSGATTGPGRVSFFDITTKTDAAGNPVEKTQFDFSLRSQTVQMWYDRSEQRWKSGVPPGSR